MPVTILHDPVAVYDYIGIPTGGLMLFKIRDNPLVEIKELMIEPLSEEEPGN